MKKQMIIMILLSSSFFLQRCECNALKTKSEACKQLAAYLQGNNSKAQLSNKTFSDGRPAIKFTYQVKYKDNYGNELTNTGSLKASDLLATFKLCVESTPELAQKLEQEIENLQPKS